MVRQCSFLDRQEKNQKKPAQGRRYENAPSPMYPTRRNASRCPKMFRFLNTYRAKTCRFSLCRHPKIGTFSGIGRRSGGGFQRGRIFVAPLWPISLVTFLFGTRK